MGKSVLMAVLLAGGSLTCLFAQLPPASYDLSGYRPQAGLTAQVDGETLRVEWQGVGDTWFALHFTVAEGGPVIEQLSNRQGDGPWRVMARGLRPEFRVVSGIRRVTQQQTDPLQRMGTPLTAAILDSIKWEE